MIHTAEKIPSETRSNMRGGNGESHAIRSAGPEPLEIIAVIMCYQEGC